MSKVFAFKNILGSVRIGHSVHALVKISDGVYTTGTIVKDNHINSYRNTTYPSIDLACTDYYDSASKALVEHRQLTQRRPPMPKDIG